MGNNAENKSTKTEGKNFYVKFHLENPFGKPGHIQKLKAPDAYSYLCKSGAEEVTKKAYDAFKAAQEKANGPQELTTQEDNQESEEQSGEGNQEGTPEGNQTQEQAPTTTQDSQGGNPQP